MHSVRDVDIVARYGGEEFSLLLPMTNVRYSKMVCERARMAIEKRNFDEKKRGLRISISMGIATLRAHAPTSSLQLIEFADQALYAAKNNGKNRSYIYVPTGENNDAAQAELERTLTLVS